MGPGVRSIHIVVIGTLTQRYTQVRVNDDMTYEINLHISKLLSSDTRIFSCMNMQGSFQEMSMRSCLILVIAFLATAAAFMPGLKAPQSSYNSIRSMSPSHRLTSSSIISTVGKGSR